MRRVVSIRWTAVAFFSVAVLQLALMWFWKNNWWSSAKDAVQSLTDATLVTVPLALVLGALQTSVRRRRRLAMLESSTPNGARAWIVRLVVLGTAVMLGYLASVLALVLFVGSQHPFSPFPIRWLVPSVAALWCAVAVGSAVGDRVPWPPACVALGPAAYAVIGYLSISANLQSLFTYDSLTATYFTKSLVFQAMQAFLYVGVAASISLVVVRRQKIAKIVAYLSIGVSGVLVAVPFPHWLGQDATARAPRCEGSVTRICLTAAQEPIRPKVTDILEPVVATARQVVGPQAQLLFTSEDIAPKAIPVRPDDIVLKVGLADDEGNLGWLPTKRGTVQGSASAVVDPNNNCPTTVGSGDVSAGSPLTTMGEVLTWFMKSVGVSLEGTGVDPRFVTGAAPLTDWLTNTTDAERSRWFAKNLEAVRACKTVRPGR